MPQICLGTAQFGMDYGITNEAGQISNQDAKNLLLLANNSGIKYLDTAQAYGNAEEIIGVNKPKLNNFKIFSKISPQNNKKLLSKDIDQCESKFKKSLNLLKVNSLECLFVHKSSDINQDYNNLLLDWLSSLKSRGLIKNIGVSIYSEEELELIPLDKIQMIQFPISIFDQHLVNKLSVLKSKGISLLGRSIFLQGLMLKSPKYWPNFISPEFLAHHAKFTTFLKKKNISLLEASLDFASRQTFLDFVLIGITSIRELKEINKTWKKVNTMDNSYQNNYDNWAWQNKSDLDPRSWPNKS